MCFVWNSEQIAIVYVYAINKLFFLYNRGGVSLLRGTHRILVYRYQRHVKAI